MNIIEVKNLTKSFKNGGGETHVLKGIDFIAERGEFIAIMGRSGAGKSTFLYQLSLLDHPTSGDITVEGRDAGTLKPAERITFRLTEFGYVFQDYALLPELSALENTALPLLMQGRERKSAVAEATKALERVGLSHRLNNLPGQLSGGEQQRTAIARAVAHAPKILFADEPTANLDNASSHAIMKIFEELNAAGQTIIMVTHEEEYAKRTERVIGFDDGRIVSETKNR